VESRELPALGPRYKRLNLFQSAMQGGCPSKDLVITSGTQREKNRIDLVEGVVDPCNELVEAQAVGPRGDESAGVAEHACAMFGPAVEKVA
jgi:hypothetical protein